MRFMNSQIPTRNASEGFWPSLAHRVGVVCIIGLMLLSGNGCKKKSDTPSNAVSLNDQKPKPEVKNEPTPTPVAEEKKVVDLKKPEERKGVLNIRVQANRPEIENDLRTFGALYQAEVGTGSPPTTTQAFMEMIKQNRSLVQKFEENVYVINLNGKKLQNSDILVYQREALGVDFSVVRASGQVERISFEQLKKEIQN